MELATVHLKLSGQIHNTVVKHNVTPAQLGLYAFMHGEDCVSTLNVTSIDKARTVAQEMNRLRAEFTSEHAAKSLNTLYPGIHPHLPTTFLAIGYDPGMLSDGTAPIISTPEAKNQSEAAIMQKIKKASEQRAQEATNGQLPALSNQALTDALDDTGDEDVDDDDDNFSTGDDPLDAELALLQNEGGR